MHYPKDAFAKDFRKPVITSVMNETSVLGNRKTFSAVCYRERERKFILTKISKYFLYSYQQFDLEKLNTLYCNSSV
jgi:hypothetical protein